LAGQDAHPGVQTVTETRRVAAEPDRVRELMGDVEAFMAASGFDGVSLEDDTLTLQNTVGLFEIELVLDVLEEPDAELVYEQREGIFDSMRTEYTLESVADGDERFREAARRELAEERKMT
jgi:hypothetical protein